VAPFPFFPGTNLWYSRRGTPTSTHTHARAHIYNLTVTFIHVFKKRFYIRKETRTSAYTKQLLECLQCLKSIANISNKTQAKSQCGFSLLLAGREEPKQIKQKGHLSLYSLKDLLEYQYIHIYIYI